MKKRMTIGITTACCCALAFALGTSAAFAAETKGSAKGGASDLIAKKEIKTVEDVASIKAGDIVAMACPKCKNIYVTTVVKDNKPGQSHVVGGERHTCPACGNITELKGHGKMATEKAVHVCKNCGSKDAFCCVLKEGGPTKGMEQPPAPAKQ